LLQRPWKQSFASYSSKFKYHAALAYYKTTLKFTIFTGPELLAKVKELGDVSKSELVRECGHLSTRKDGS
jgi:hypothetical protein